MLDKFKRAGDNSTTTGQRPSVDLTVEFDFFLIETRKAGSHLMMRNGIDSKGSSAR